MEQTRKLNYWVPALCAAIAVSLLQGCATPPAPAPEVKPDPASVRIDESLAKAQTEKPLGIEVPPAKPVYAREASTVSYLGDARNLLQDMATAMGMKMKVTGPQPYLPIYVHVNAKGTPFRELLTEIARQCSERADVVLRNGDTIELRYRPQ